MDECHARGGSDCVGALLNCVFCKTRGGNLPHFFQLKSFCSGSENTDMKGQITEPEF